MGVGVFEMHFSSREWGQINFFWQEMPFLQFLVPRNINNVISRGKKWGWIHMKYISRPEKLE